MKTNTPIAFAFENAAVRIIPDAEKPLFVAKDVAAALGYENTSKAINDFCDGVTIRYSIADRLGRKQEVRVIDEPDVYRLIFGSKLESAKRFQNWVFEEVLPAIRKSGGYGALSPSDEIRYMNQRLALLRELRHERDPLLREKIYEQFRTVSDRLGYETPALDAFAAPHPHDALDPATRRVLDAFWQAMEALANLAIPVNHHRDGRYFAINLKEIMTLCEDNGIALPGRIELKRALPMSRAPAFIAASHTVCSRHAMSRSGKPATPRCYIFNSPRA